MKHKELEKLIGYKKIEPKYKINREYLKRLEESGIDKVFIDSMKGLEGLKELLSVSPREIYDWLGYIDEEIKKREYPALVN